MAVNKGWRYVAFISGFVGLVGLTLYPIAISPMIDSSQYRIQGLVIEGLLFIALKKISIYLVRLVGFIMTSVNSSDHWIVAHTVCFSHRNRYELDLKKIQQDTRKNIRQEDIQPGNMKVWSDPFERKKTAAE